MRLERRDAVGHLAAAGCGAHRSGRPLRSVAAREGSADSRALSSGFRDRDLFCRDANSMVCIRWSKLLFRCAMANSIFIFRCC